MVFSVVRHQRRFCTICFLAFLFVVVTGGVVVQAALDAEPLQLSLNPLLSVNGEGCGYCPVPEAMSGRPGKRSRPVQESEHRPVPHRSYHLTMLRTYNGVKAFVRRPDGSVIEPELLLGMNGGLSFPTPMGDGPFHGANNVYVVEQSVDEDRLLVRTAKWITMHHSCGWGHDGKFDKTLTTPQALDTIPLEVLINKLWDSNFHASVTSGEELLITVLLYGKPIPDARVIVTTEQGWSKQIVTDQNGTASLQLIRDYYPSSWAGFRRTYRGKFMVTAEYDLEQAGEYNYKPYQRVTYISTLPWKYSPSRQDYSSYRYGLIIAGLAMTVSGIGVYFYRERRRKPYRRITFDE
jgi:hypothetical protein